MALLQAAVVSGAAGRPQRILVVDDEPDIREGIRRLLEKSLRNVDVITASDGAQGLRALANGTVDLIVTDYKMPGMNGVEFIHQASALAPHAPHILITAFEQELARDLAEQHEVGCVLTKPLDPRPLVQTCQRMLAAGAA